jgi:hypothetical protein
LHSPSVSAIEAAGTGGGGDPANATSGTDPAFSGGDCGDAKHCDLIVHYINPFIDFLAALVGLGTVISIVIGGIQYGSSGGDPGAVTAAKTRIRNSLIAFITFLFLFVLLQWLVPGGLF